MRRRDPVRREGTLGPVRRAFRLRRLPPLCLEPAGGGPQGALGVEKNMEGKGDGHEIMRILAWVL